MTLDSDVVIVGAGPVGLVTALMIARQDISVTVLERFSEVIQSPRAMAYGPAAVVELERAGIAEDCRKVGMEPDDYNVEIRWITVDNKKIAGFERPRGDGNKGGYDPVICGQHKVAEIILKHLEQYPKAKVLWDHSVTGIKDHGDSVTAVCETKTGTAEIAGRYLVGSDGARSTVRKLIGCTFDGFTYDKMVVATNVYYPFRENGFSLAQFIVDPENFALVPSPRISINYPGLRGL
jgi:2-polyprenyl-6-methoxyphenol hydroxylase-like FAD-dependent oxidoreductase